MKATTSKRSASRSKLRVHPAAEYGWRALTASARKALSAEVTSSRHIEQTKLPDTYSAKNGDVRVIFKKEESGASTIISVFTAREFNAFR
ncbi:hypothetical protein [Stenotrophomonas sp. MH181796]|uniref:hypothetical protein n=1 Tax=Stenotrophomonas sp. MH181796 TaxID=2339228 RepID=UPI00129CCCB1|nr:hypothetical protein [Stenotrophomonas sp. MH181796]